MPRKPKSTQQIPVSPPAPSAWQPFGMPGQVAVGVPVFHVQPPPMADRNIVKSDLKDNIITLDDGSTIVVTPTIQNVKRLLGQVGPAGEPVYVMQLSWTVKTRTPTSPSSSGSAKKSAKSGATK